VGHVAHLGGSGEKRCIQGVGGEIKGKRPLGRSRLRWKDNIKLDLQDVRRRGMEWIDLAQERDRL